MVLPWRDRLEKELGFDERFLPLLWVKAQGEEAQIRLKYMDLVTRLYNENFTKVIGDWCRDHGVWYLGHTIEDNGAHARLGYGTGHYFRGQQDMDFAGIDVIGGQVVPGMNYHHDAFNTGGSNGEFYHYALAKLGSSAAHLDPKKKGRVMCEAFGAYGWNEGLKTMKWIADHLLVRGVNWIVPHAFDPKEFPDFDCPPHFYAHGHNPQFRYFPVFSGYVNRIAGLFREGRHPAKVGIYYPAETEWMGESMPVEKPARILTENQISFDIVSLDYLEGARIGEGCYTINGQTMEVLVVPCAERLPERLKNVIRRLQEAGARVFFADGKPEGTEGSVIPLEELGQALSEYRGIRCAQDQPDLVLGEYERDGSRYYMLFNENVGQAVHTEITIPGLDADDRRQTAEESGTDLCHFNGYVSRYDGFSDTLTRAEHHMMLHLEPYESAVFIVSQEEPEYGSKQEKDSAAERIFLPVREGQDGWHFCRLPETWKVRFTDSRSYPEWICEAPVDSLCCVQQIEGWDAKAGTLRFETQLENDAVEAAEAVLDLGTVYETADVFVNGISAGVRLCKPYRFDLTGLLRSGANDIAIEVTNTLGTEVRDALSHYLAIEPFGIQGPVKLHVRGGRNLR